MSTENDWVGLPASQQKAKNYQKEIEIVRKNPGMSKKRCIARFAVVCGGTKYSATLDFSVLLDAGFIFYEENGGVRLPKTKEEVEQEL